MTDSNSEEEAGAAGDEQQQSEGSGNAAVQGLLQALRGVAADARTRQTVTELGERARGIVEELSRGTVRHRDSAAAARAAASTAAAEDSPHRTWSGSADGPVPAGLQRRIDELRAGVGEVADVLEATLERLETLESQLGDPDQSVEQQLRDGIDRCERVLDGIEHRITRAAASGGQAGEESQPRSGRPLVLVVAAGSRRRAELCIALEQQGLHTLAAVDLRQARSAAARHAISAALVEASGSAAEQAVLLETWKNCQDRGELPRAALLGPAAGELDATALELPVIDAEYGVAALAASLLKLAGNAPDE